MPKTDNIVNWYYNRYCGRSLEVQRGDAPIADPKHFGHGDDKYLDKDGFLTGDTVKQLAWRHLITETTAKNYRQPVAKGDDFPLKQHPALKRPEKAKVEVKSEPKEVKKDVK